MGEKVLVTFDVDGTIIDCPDGGKNHIIAINLAANELYGTPKDINMEEYIGHSFVGTTDYWIVERIVEKAKGQASVSPEECLKFLELEYQYYLKLGCGEFVALPGVKKTLETLNSMPNVTVSLSTGNYDKIAWKKIEHAGVLDLFKERIGGFGHILERSDILRFARKQAEELRGFKFDRHVHIGDAIQDVRAAQDANAVPVAVETGSKKKADFPQPCFVIPNLEKGFDEFINIVKTGKPN